MMEINYLVLLQKTRDILLMWRYRDLTAMSKVQVINVLVTSIFAYRFTCLPSPKEEFIKQHKSLIKEFLWKKGLIKLSMTR